MEEIKVGEYVINQNRLVIAQIIEINKSRQEAIIKTNNIEIPIGFWNIRKHSFNLIDLIENNDIVLIKTKGTKFVNLGIVRKRKDIRSGKVNILINGLNINEFEILEVLTHEQYDANCYKVKGE